MPAPSPIIPSSRVWVCPGAPASYMALAAPYLPAPQGKALRVAVSGGVIGDDEPPTPEQVVATVAGASVEFVGAAEVDGFGIGGFYYVDVA